MLKLLGLIDATAAILLILSQFDITQQVLTIIVALAVIGKGLVFFSFVGFIDILAGIMLMLSFYNLPSLVIWLSAAWLGQKALFSLAGKS